MSDSDQQKARREGEENRPVRSPVQDEVRRLAADGRDRDEMRIIREQLAELVPAWSVWGISHPDDSDA
jgi:hypothetical protein